MTDTSPFIGSTRVVPGSPEPEGFHGPYRGVVTNISDPSSQGRVKAIIPQLFGNTSTECDWALPCQSPGVFVTPQPGMGVWIMFEGGDINYPMYMGMWQPQAQLSPYEVAGAGASAVTQSEAYTRTYANSIGVTTLSQAEAYTNAQLAAYVPLSSNPAGYATQTSNQSISTTPLQMSNTSASWLKGGVTYGSNQFTVPVAGVYAYTAQISWNLGPGTLSIATYLWHNGAFVSPQGTYFPYISNGGELEIATSGLVICSASDTLSWAGYNTSGPISTSSSTTGRTYMFIWLVSQ